MYGLSLSKIPYADFLDTLIYVHSLIENLIFEVIILIDVCHFDQAAAHRCFVRTVLQGSLSSCLSFLTFCMIGNNNKKTKKKSQWGLRKGRCLARLPDLSFIVSSLLKTILFQALLTVMEDRRNKNKCNSDLPPPIRELPFSVPMPRPHRSSCGVGMRGSFSCFCS